MKITLDDKLWAENNYSTNLSTYAFAEKIVQAPSHAAARLLAEKVKLEWIRFWDSC